MHRQNRLRVPTPGTAQAVIILHIHFPCHLGRASVSLLAGFDH